MELGARCGVTEAPGEAERAIWAGLDWSEA
jgi:hypothetical protein